MRSIINAGHTRRTAVVARCVGDDHEPRLFSVWCARWLAMIGLLPPATETRAIVILMRRLTGHDRVEELQQADLPRGLSLYALRHTFASHCLAAGERPVTVAKWLGHADVRTTYTFYAHALPDETIRPRSTA